MCKTTKFGNLFVPLWIKIRLLKCECQSETQAKDTVSTRFTSCFCERLMRNSHILLTQIVLHCFPSCGPNLTLLSTNICFLFCLHTLGHRRSDTDYNICGASLSLCSVLHYQVQRLMINADNREVNDCFHSLQTESIFFFFYLCRGLF